MEVHVAFRTFFIRFYSIYQGFQIEKGNFGSISFEFLSYTS